MDATEEKDLAKKFEVKGYLGQKPMVFLCWFVGCGCLFLGECFSWCILAGFQPWSGLRARREANTPVVGRLKQLLIGWDPCNLTLGNWQGIAGNPWEDAILLVFEICKSSIDDYFSVNLLTIVAFLGDMLCITDSCGIVFPHPFDADVCKRLPSWQSRVSFLCCNRHLLRTGPAVRETSSPDPAGPDKPQMILKVAW